MLLSCSLRQRKKRAMDWMRTAAHAPSVRRCRTHILSLPARYTRWTMSTGDRRLRRVMRCRSSIFMALMCRSGDADG